MRLAPPATQFPSIARTVIFRLVGIVSIVLYVHQNANAQIKPHLIVGRLELEPCLGPVLAVLQQLKSLFYTKGLGSGAGQRSVPQKQAHTFSEC
jgi:hypothetical protein